MGFIPDHLQTNKINNVIQLKIFLLIVHDPVWHVALLSGDQSDQKLALQNIASMVRPGGILIIDHRNYDYILETGRAPQGKNIYYKVLNLMEFVPEGANCHVDGSFCNASSIASAAIFLIHLEHVTISSKSVQSTKHEKFLCMFLCTVFLTLHEQTINIFNYFNFWTFLCLRADWQYLTG